MLGNLTSDVSEHYENTTHNHRETCVDGIIDKGPSSHNNFCLITNHNDASKSPWISVDLLGQKFDKVVLHNRVDCCQQLINGASVSISADKDGKQILWTDSIPHTSDKQFVFHGLPFTTDKNPTPIKETSKDTKAKTTSTVKIESGPVPLVSDSTVKRTEGNTPIFPKTETTADSTIQSETAPKTESVTAPKTESATAPKTESVTAPKTESATAIKEESATPQKTATKTEPVKATKIDQQVKQKQNKR